MSETKWPTKASHIAYLENQLAAKDAEIERLQNAGCRCGMLRVECKSHAAIRARAEKAERERDEALIDLENASRERGAFRYERNAAEARVAKLTEALREIADNPLPAEPGYECAWCNGVRKHHKECPCSRAAAALAAEGAK